MPRVPQPPRDRPSSPSPASLGTRTARATPSARVVLVSVVPRALVLWSTTTRLQSWAHYCS
eukprot:3800586-Pyramimonas_sp.AAC.1